MRELSDRSIQNIESKNKQSLYKMNQTFSDAQNLNRTGKRSMKERVSLNKRCSDLNSERLDSFWHSNFLMKTILTDTTKSE
jgi:hypothetical protein